MKTAVPILVFLVVTILANCSGSPVGPEPQQPDRISGVFYLQGPKTTTGPPCLHCLPDNETLQEIIYHSVNVQLVEGKQDTVRFFGVYGADAGDTADRVFPDCTSSNDCKVYGRLTSSEQYEIDIEHSGRRFRATGVIRTVTFTLEGQYTHENRTIDYELEGKRVDFYN